MSIVDQLEAASLEAELMQLEAQRGEAARERRIAMKVVATSFPNTPEWTAADARARQMNIRERMAQSHISKVRHRLMAINDMPQWACGCWHCS